MGVGILYNCNSTINNFLILYLTVIFKKITSLNFGCGLFSCVWKLKSSWQITIQNFIRCMSPSGNSFSILPCVNIKMQYAKQKSYHSTTSLFQGQIQLCPGLTPGLLTVLEDYTGCWRYNPSWPHTRKAPYLLYLLALKPQQQQNIFGF